MKLEILAVRDAKLDAFMTPFFSQTVSAAVRSLGDLVNGDQREPIAQHPEDYGLWHFGTMNALDGVFTLLPRPVLVVMCDSVKNQVEAAGPRRVS